ncbi:MAG: DUF1800 domain-containing protein [Chloroflexota bacterium]|nr:DUF1800 domain-containing protein [Chloroflexota bacterium]MDE2961836.1 DUF1800 domain-containing protein [Chloroflexota bacterium]
MTLTGNPQLGMSRIALADPDTIRAAHLLRRAGFTPTRAEIDRAVDRGYEATVDELLHPEDRPDLEIEDLIRRYHVDQNSLMLLESSQGYWMYRIINSQRPLEEKMALFWHGLFATAYGKLNHAKAVVNQTHTFRRHGLGKFANILVELSRDPAMIFWLDNKDNHRDAPNENYGRELLELFSMGIGNYTEDDVKAAARAFTGWTIDNSEYMSIRASRDSFWPYGRIDWQFRYREDDHDDTEKTFLGHTGPLGGQDVIDIIVKQPATAYYIAGKLYTFFVSDRPDEEAIGIMADEFTRTEGDIRSVMRCMFRSNFFADEAVRLARVKSPAELVGGTARLAGSHRSPEWTISNLAMDVNFMGQEILNPPTVEGWHTGMEWIDTGNLVERINAAGAEMRDTNRPGVRAIIDRVRSAGDRLEPRQLAEACLDAMGMFEVSDGTMDSLVALAAPWGEIRFDRADGVACAEERVVEMLQLIVASREYQLA